MTAHLLMLAAVLSLTVTCRKEKKPSQEESIFVGQAYEGGKVAYIFEPGDAGYVAGKAHGLVVATVDQSIAAEWGCYGTSIVDASGTSIGEGRGNTLNIMNSCIAIKTAASICGDLVSGGYSDWYLPAIDELDKVYRNRNLIDSTINDRYWTSSQKDSKNAWLQNFANGDQYINAKSSNARVRAIRTF